MNKREQAILTEADMINRWSFLVDDIEDTNTQIATTMVLENSFKHAVDNDQLPENFFDYLDDESLMLTEAGTKSSNVASNVIPKVLFPVIRRVMPKLIANKIVSVQPIQARTGVIYYITYQYTNTKGDITADDEFSANASQGAPGFATFYTSERIGPFETTASSSDVTINCDDKISTFLGITAADFTVKRIEVYNKTTGAAYATVLSTETDPVSSITWGTANVAYDVSDGDIMIRSATDSPWTAGDELVVFLVYDQESSSDIPEMQFKIDSKDVTTTERKLKVTWTKESEQDMKAFHGIDVESELVKVASMQMNYEIDREIIREIDRYTPSQLSFIHDWTSDSFSTGNNTTGNFLDRHRAVQQKLYQVAAKIAQYNRLGGANWLIASPQVAALLSQLPDFQGEIAGSQFTIQEGGSLGNGKMNLFIDNNRTGTDANTITLGYKSSDSVYGAGIVYAPYVNWMSDTIADPSNFDSIRGFFTRYAIDLVPRGQWHYGRLTLLNYGV